jgi:hypothetical protein
MQNINHLFQSDVQGDLNDQATTSWNMEGEDLPFAMEVVKNDDDTPQDSTVWLKTGTRVPPYTPDTSSETVASSGLSSSHQSQSHPNAFSLTTTDSHGDASSSLNVSHDEMVPNTHTSTSVGVSSSLLDADSCDLEAAASLLLPTVGAESTNEASSSSSVLLTTSSSTATTTIPQNFLATPAAPKPMATSQAFSQLLEAADDARPQIQRQVPQQPSTFTIQKVSHSMETIPTGQRLESLPEETDERGTERSETSDCIILEAVNQNINESYSASSSLRQHNTRWRSNNNIVPVTTATNQAAPLSLSASRLASLAGATAFLTGEDQFQISIHVTSSHQHPINIPGVIDLLSNPHLLHLWCDPIVSEVIILKTSDHGSEGCRLQNRDPNRIHEGEWMEATTRRPLLLPPGYGRNCTQSLRNALGWTELATIVVFVERLLSRVNISISKFPGNVEITHVLEVSELPCDSGKVRIQNSVRVKPMYDDTDSSNSSCCGILDMMGQCFQPTTQEYMDQTLGSMARLRFLIEHHFHEPGETNLLSTPDRWIAADHRHGDDMCSPLLVHA